MRLEKQQVLGTEGPRGRGHSHAGGSAGLLATLSGWILKFTETGVLCVSDTNLNLAMKVHERHGDLTSQMFCGGDRTVVNGWVTGPCSILSEGWSVKGQVLSDHLPPHLSVFLLGYAKGLTLFISRERQPAL